MEPNPKIDQAFILCAGFGTRLRPYTDDCPKPLVKVAGRPILDYIVEALKRHGVRKIIINAHYKAQYLQEYTQNLSGFDEVIYSYEDKILETGGGLKYALDCLKGKDFFAINGDQFWEEGPDKTALQRLEEAWDPRAMEILMLLHPIERMTLTKGYGDYDLEENGLAKRSLNKSGIYSFSSVRISRTDIFNDTPMGKFSYLELMDRAQDNKKLYGIVHQGQWHHISTPDDLHKVSDALSKDQKIAL